MQKDRSPSEEQVVWLQSEKPHWYRPINICRNVKYLSFQGSRKMCLRGRAEEWKQISPAVMHVINKLPYHSPIYAYKCVIIFLILPSYKCGHVAGCTSRCKDSMAYIYTPMELI